MYLIKKVLSKKDFIGLLEISSKAIVCDNENDFKALFLKLKNLIVFKYSNCVYADISNIPVVDKLPARLVKVNYPEELVNVYLDKKQHLRDHIFQEFFRTYKILNCRDTEKKYPLESWKDVVYTAREFGIRDGFMYGVRDLNKRYGTCFSFLGPRTENNERTRTIIEYAVPFLSVTVKRLLGNQKNDSAEALTSRETEVLKWLKEGKTSWEISQILNVAESTINFHVRNILRKLNSINRTQAVAIAVDNGWLEL